MRDVVAQSVVALRQSRPDRMTFRTARECQFFLTAFALAVPWQIQA